MQPRNKPSSTLQCWHGLARAGTVPCRKPCAMLASDMQRRNTAHARIPSVKRGKAAVAIIASGSASLNLHGAATVSACACFVIARPVR